MVCLSELLEMSYCSFGTEVDSRTFWNEVVERHQQDMWADLLGVKSALSRGDELKRISDSYLSLSGTDG